jgi:hypothetical protein
MPYVVTILVDKLYDTTSQLMALMQGTSIDYSVAPSEPQEPSVAVQYAHVYDAYLGRRRDAVDR